MTEATQKENRSLMCESEYVSHLMRKIKPTMTRGHLKPSIFDGEVQWSNVSMTVHVSNGEQQLQEQVKLPKRSVKYNLKKNI